MLVQADRARPQSFEHARNPRCVSVATRTPPDQSERIRLDGTGAPTAQEVGPIVEAVAAFRRQPAGPDDPPTELFGQCRVEDRLGNGAEAQQALADRNAALLRMAQRPFERLRIECMELDQQVAEPHDRLRGLRFDDGPVLYAKRALAPLWILNDQRPGHSPFEKRNEHVSEGGRG